MHQVKGPGSVVDTALRSRGTRVRVVSTCFAQCRLNVESTAGDLAVELEHRMEYLLKDRCNPWG
jgi:hypothetical protein